MYETSGQLKVRLDAMVDELGPDARKLWDRVQQHADAGEDFYEDGGHIWLIPAMMRLGPAEKAAFVEANRIAGLYYYELKLELDQLN